MEDYSNLKKQFQNTLKYFQENFDLIDKNNELKFKLEDKEFNEFQILEDEFKKYKRFKNIKRFSIPIIGMISCGKSSLLNFLLGMNCLEKGDDITTKSVVIIRHNKNLKNDERYIYSVIINERSEDYYDFEIDEKTKSKDINKVITERNDYIKNAEEIKTLKKEDFFLILEANIPLFSNKNKIYGDFFEFLDLPGLDEGEKDSKSFKSSNFFKEHILPKLACNSLFSILIFDAEKYMNRENPIIFKNYLNKYFPINYSNSFFILNKTDLMDDKKKEEKIFEEEMLKNKLNINLDDKSIHIKYLSCKELTNEIKKFEDFQSYLKYLLIKGTTEKKTNFLQYLKENIKREFQIEKAEIGNETPTEEQKPDIKSKISELDRETSSFPKTLRLSEYFNYSKFFNQKIVELKDKEKEKSEKYKELFENFYLSFNNSINYFINIPNDESISKRIKNIIQIFDNLSKESKDSIEKAKNYIDLLYKDLSSDAKLSIEQFQKLKPIVEELYKNGKSFETFKNLKEEFKLIEFFIKKDKKIRIPLFGCYSTGKSSTLNCIIGKKILPEGNQVTTRKIIVIRNGDENKYVLSETNFVKTNEDYYCFEDGKELLSKDESNYKDIYDFIKKKNEDKNDKNMFYLLTAPILLFKKMKISKEILNKIELIDFPGVDVDEEGLQDIFNNIIQLSDTFIFMNECNLVKNSGNIETIKKIVNRIENRRFTFDYNSCLFVLNKADLADNKIDKIKKKKEFENILFQTENFNSFLDYFKKRENPEISVSIFCSHYFLKYLNFYNEMKDFEKCINKNIDEIILENQETGDFDLIEELENKLLDILETYFEKIKIKEIENNEFISKLKTLKTCLNDKGINDKQIKDNSKRLNNIIIYYHNMITHIEKNTFYLDSWANLFFSDLEKKFIIAKDMTEKQYIEKIKQFIKELQIIFKLLQQKSINSRVINITELKEKMNQKASDIYKCYEESSKIIKEKIDGIFTNIIKKINDLINLENDNNIEAPELKRRINDFIKRYGNEMKNLDEFIKNHFFSLQYKLNNQINSSLADTLLFGGESERENNWYISHNTFFGINELFDHKFFLNGIYSTLGDYLIGHLYCDILAYLLNTKEHQIKDLKSMKKVIENHWDSVFYKSNIILIKSINEAYKNMMMVYETQMSEFNEKTIQNLFKKFIEIIDDKYKGNK